MPSKNDTEWTTIDGTASLKIEFSLSFHWPFAFNHWRVCAKLFATIWTPWRYVSDASVDFSTVFTNDTAGLVIIRFLLYPLFLQDWLQPLFLTPFDPFIPRPFFFLFWKMLFVFPVCLHRILHAFSTHWHILRSFSWYGGHIALYKMTKCLFFTDNFREVDDLVKTTKGAPSIVFEG